MSLLASKARLLKLIQYLDTLLASLSVKDFSGLVVVSGAKPAGFAGSAGSVVAEPTVPTPSSWLCIVGSISGNVISATATRGSASAGCLASCGKAGGPIIILFLLVTVPRVSTSGSYHLTAIKALVACLPACLTSHVCHFSKTIIQGIGILRSRKRLLTSNKSNCSKCRSTEKACRW